MFNRLVKLVAPVGCTLDVASPKDLFTRYFKVFVADVWQCSDWCFVLPCTPSDSVYVDTLV